MNKLQKILAISTVISGTLLGAYLGKCVQNYSEEKDIRTENYVYISKSIGAFGKVSYFMIKEGETKKEITVEESLFRIKNIKFLNNQFQYAKEKTSGIPGKHSLVNRTSHRYHQLDEIGSFKEIKSELNKK